MSQDSHDFMRANQLRHLPVYLLLDCSGSMSGDPITAVNEGVTMIRRELVNDPQALETVYISIITFSSRADQYQLTPIDQFRPPILSAGGSTAMGEAFRILVQSIEQDLVLNQVHVDGMRLRGLVRELPYLRGAEDREFRRIAPSKIAEPELLEHRIEPQLEADSTFLRMA